MATIIKITGTFSEDKPFYQLRRNGFTEANLKNLYLFDDADPKVLALDKMGNHHAAVALGSAGSVKSNLAGGGIGITKNSSLTGSPINATLPFSLMFAGKIGALSFPVTGGLLSFSEYYTRGFSFYFSNTALAPMVTVVRQALNGAQDSAGQGNWSTTAAYDTPVCFFVTYDGAGNMNFYRFSAESMLGKKTTPFAINETGYTTNGSAVVNNMLTPSLGCPNGIFSTGKLDADVFAVWEKELTVEEMLTNSGRAHEIMTTRGRFLG